VELRVEQPKKAAERLRLCFVGVDFMRKGGPILVRAHRELRKRGIPVDTTIVSRMTWSPKDYVGPPSEGVYHGEMELVATDGIEMKKCLANDETLRVMTDCDYFVFPTFHDTFGFVTIEALAGGTPVIAHGTCAQPELIEHGVSGSVLPFPNDGAGD
jgi:glycosyltransferase involved in cell wall biosynthesis